MSFARDVSASAIGAGLLAAMVGYTSTIAVVIHGLAAVGASQGQIVSGVAGIGIALAIPSIVLSLATRQPIVGAWSTPGFVLLASTGAVPGGFPAAVGAFIAAGLLIMLAGLWRPLGRIVAAIPRPIASGMLAGILLPLCLAPFRALGTVPLTALAVILAWVAVSRVARLWAAPAALLVAIAIMASNGLTIGGAPLWPHLELVRPIFTPAAMVSIALPLFVVTMASQNIPGLAVLATYDYRPSPSPIFLWTGLASAVGALVGAGTVNLAAITAALCASPDSHPDPARRYVAALAGAGAYFIFGLFAAVTVAVVGQASPVLIEAVAGLALISALGAALSGAVASEPDRLPALATLLVTASGVSLFGVGAAFWGLLAGVALHGLDRLPLRPLAR